MASAKLIFEKPTFAVVTGASQGLGKSITIALAAELASESVIAISARSKEALQKTAELALSERRARNASGDIKILCVTADLSKSEDIKNLINSCVRDRPNTDFTTALLLLNFGTLGDISKEFCDFRNPDEVAEYFRINLAHIPVLAGEFIDWAITADRKLDTVIVNVSSLAAVKPLLCTSLYSSGKAARDMLLQVLAVENPNVRVLNWAPGPLLGTNMTKTIWTTANKHNTAASFLAMKEKGQYLTCKQSTTKFIGLLRKDSYANGAHVDYYDVGDI